jgi:hypothetical protein
MPVRGAVAMELSVGWRLAAVVPGDRGSRNSQLEAVSVVRIMGSWVHEENPQVRPAFSLQCALRKADRIRGQSAQSQHDEPGSHVSCAG